MLQGLGKKLGLLRGNLPIFSSYEIIILTETWLLLDILDSELGLASFQVLRLDRSIRTSQYSRGGGVPIAIKSHLQASVISTILYSK